MGIETNPDGSKFFNGVSIPLNAPDGGTGCGNFVSNSCSGKVPLIIFPPSKDAVASIISICETVYPDNHSDCSAFLKEVAGKFFGRLGFAAYQADGIVDFLRDRSHYWIDLQGDPQLAINAAANGNFVIAGMKSTEFMPHARNGHVAVVVGLPGRFSGQILVPVCYAGSLHDRAPVNKEAVSWTFGKEYAREKKISYFSKYPEKIP